MSEVIILSLIALAFLFMIVLLVFRKPLSEYLAPKLLRDEGIVSNEMAEQFLDRVFKKPPVEEDKKKPNQNQSHF